MDMKKMKIVFILSIVMMFVSSIVSAMAVSAYLYNSNEVSYNNNASGITSTNVQGAIDELYEHATDYTNMNTRVTYLENKYVDNFHKFGGIEGVELNNTGILSAYGGYIDFHYGGSSADYTTRIIESPSGVLNLNAPNGVKVNGVNINGVSTTTFTIGASTGVRAFKWGQVVTLATTGSGNQEAAQASQTIVGTVPAGYRPAYMVEYKDNYTNTRFIINPDGSIKAQAASPNTFWRFTTTYVSSG